MLFCKASMVLRKIHLIITIVLIFQSIEMKVDNCGLSSCMRLKAPIGTSEFLNVNSPLQIGGSISNLAKLGEKFNWQHVPTETRFVGCIRNMTINGNVCLYYI
jgi:hypothetical protein